MITCNLKGGIGNQLFQIAVSYSLAKQKDISFAIIDQQFDGAGTGSHPSKYYANLFQQVPKITLKNNHPIRVYKEPRWIYTPITESVQPNTILQLDGYFQSDKYFLNYSSEIKQLFTPQDYVKNWLKSNSGIFEQFPELFDDHDFCFIGVRRGDYIAKAAYHNPCGKDYYIKALAALPAKRYYIGSDDIAWCKRNFIGPQYIFFDIQDDLIQLLTGCLFKNYIIANSTFHWWMSFLSVFENPTIIAPDKWTFGANAQFGQYSTIYRDGMQVIQRLIEV